MPIYAYECTVCGTQEEQIQKLDAPPPEEGCQACGKALRKILTTASVIMGEHAAVSRGNAASPSAKHAYDGLMEAAQGGPDDAHAYVKETGGAAHEYRHVGS